MNKRNKMSTNVNKRKDPWHRTGAVPTPTPIETNPIAVCTAKYKNKSPISESNLRHIIAKEVTRRTANRTVILPEFTQQQFKKAIRILELANLFKHHEILKCNPLTATEVMYKSRQRHK